MPAKKSVKPPIAAGRWRVQSAASCNSRDAIPSIRGPSVEPAASSADSRFGGAGRLSRKQTGFEPGRQVEYHIADRDPAARLAGRPAEDPEGQVLNREF